MNDEYERGIQFATENYHCPCFKCLIQKMGKTLLEAQQHREGFWSVAQLDLDGAARIDPANCPYCDRGRK